MSLLYAFKYQKEHSAFHRAVLYLFMRISAWVHNEDREVDMEDAAFNPEEDLAASPCVEIESSLGKLALTWFNTTIRIFNPPTFNHIEYVDDDGEVTGFQVGQEFMDLLFEHEYPMVMQPFVDRQTREWYVASQVKNMDAEIEDLLG